MKERPILFNSEMVKAILDGRKTQTRRPLKGKWFDFIGSDDFGVTMIDDDCMEHDLKCPFGQVGDELYVRETFRVSSLRHYDKRLTVEFKADSGSIRLDKEDHNVIEHDERWDSGWKPSIHMPKEYSRIQLKVINIKVERVHSMSEDNAIAEGFKSTAELTDSGDDYTGLYASEHFADTWNNIYGNWNDNPWVWVVEFKRVNK